MVQRGVKGQAHKRQAEQQVNGGDEQAGAEVVKGLGGDTVVGTGEAKQLDHQDERGVSEEQEDEVVGYGRQDEPERLRHDDEPDALVAHEAKREGGLHATLLGTARTPARSSTRLA